MSAERENIPAYNDCGQDYTEEWGKLLQGGEEDFPTEASFANHFFDWLHEIRGEKRTLFDCTDADSFRLIPPRDYLSAYREAKRRGII